MVQVRICFTLMSHAIAFSKLVTLVKTIFSNLALDISLAIIGIIMKDLMVTDKV